MAWGLALHSDDAVPLVHAPGIRAVEPRRVWWDAWACIDIAGIIVNLFGMNQGICNCSICFMCTQWMNP